MQKEKEDSLKAGLASIQKVKETGNKEIAEVPSELSALWQQKDQERESVQAEITATKKPHETETAKIRADINAIRQQKGQEAKSLRYKLSSAQATPDAELVTIQKEKTDVIEALRAEVTAAKNVREMADPKIRAALDVIQQ